MSRGKRITYHLKKIILIAFCLSFISSASAELWTQTNGPPGGAFHVIEVNPDNPDILYVGSSYSFFRSDNAGESWQRVNKIHDMLRGREFNVRTVVFNPQNPRIVYMAATNAGLFKSSDNGLSWSRITEDLDIGGTDTVALDPSEPDIIYIATNVGKGRRKIYKSINGGRSWNDITGNLPATLELNVLAVVKHNEIYAGGGFGMGGRGDLYHSTDGGKTWKVENIGQGEEAHVSTVKVDPVDNDHIFIGFGDVYGRWKQLDEVLFETYDGGETWKPATGVEWVEKRFFTGWQTPGVDARIYNIEIFPTNNKLIHFLLPWRRSRDGGKTWEGLKISGLAHTEPIDIAINPKNEDILYAALLGQGVAKSTDGGKTWRLANKGLVGSTITNIVTDPKNSNIVYVSGGDGSGTWKTTDRGENWFFLNKGGIDHPWVDELTINPRDSNILFNVADIGRIFKTQDGGKTWKEINNGFWFSSIFALEANPHNEDEVYAMNNGWGIFKTMDGGKRWKYLQYSPDYSYDIEIDPSDPNVIYSAHTRKYFEESSNVFKSENGGEDWKVVLNVKDSEGIRSIKVDNQNPNRVLASSVGKRGEIYESLNKGKRWKRITGDFTFTSIHSLEVDQENGIIYAGTWGGRIYKTHNYGKTWTELENSPRYPSSIKVNPKETNIIYAISGVKPEVFKSKDKGQSWELLYDAGEEYSRMIALAVDQDGIVYVSGFKKDKYTDELPTKEDFFQGSLFKIENNQITDITSNLPRGVVNIAIDPTNPEIIYVSTEVYDVYKTEDGGQNWKKLDGIPDREVLALAINPENPEIIYAGTLSQGVTKVGQSPSFGLPIDLDYPSGSCGLYKSEDSGETWSNIKAEVEIRSILINPQAPDIVYVTTETGVYKLSDNQWQLQGGLSFEDNGPIVESQGRIYIGSHGAGVFKGTINEENNINWEETKGPVIHVSDIQLAIDAHNSNIIYASSYPGGMFKSKDGGKTWSEKNTGLFCTVVDPNRQVYYNFDIDPTEPNRLYLALYGVGVHRSDNGGDNWETLNGRKGELSEKPLSQIKVNPQNPSEIFVTSPDGVYYTFNRGQSWQRIIKGLTNHDMFSLAITSTGKVYAGNRGYGVYTYNRDWNGWQKTGPVTNFGVHWWVWDRPLYLYNALLINPFYPNIMYFGTFPTGFYKTVDGGKTWYESNMSFTIDGAFSMTFHPYNKSIIYAGTYNGISKSEDSGKSWRKIDKGMPAEQWVFSIAFNPANPKIMYAASKNGEDKGKGREGLRGMVMKSTDGGENWFEIMNGLDKNKEYYQLEMYPYNYDILFVSAREGVYMTKDGGKSWQAINNGLLSVRIGERSIHDKIFAKESRDGGKSWQDINNGLAPTGRVIGSGVVNNVANNLKLDAEGRYLYLGTRDRGVFRADLEQLKLKKDPNAIPLHCFNYVQDGDEEGVDCGGSCFVSYGNYDYGFEEATDKGEEEKEKERTQSKMWMK